MLQAGRQAGSERREGESAAVCLSSLHLQASRECTVRGGSVLAEELQQGRSADSRGSAAAKEEEDGG